MESVKQEQHANQLARGGLLDRFFKLTEHRTTIKTELLAGLTTFVTMAYIIFVNPNIMATAGIDHGAAFVATCIGAALGCFLMGLYANWPVGLAPGMGLNAFFTYTVVGEMGYSWEIALGAVFISGVLFMIMSLSKIREWLLNSIPMSLRFAMGAGVGLFLGLIGLKTAGIVVDSPATLLTMGSFGNPSALLAAVCFLMIAVLSHRNVFGAILFSMLGVTAIGWALGLVEYGGLVSMPPSLAPTFLAMDIAGAFNVAMISVILAFLFVNMFDTAGTLMGVAHRANLVDEDGKIQNLSKALKADSTSSVVGAMVGCPPVTSYVESAAGVAAGGRTGLTAITVGLLFLAAMFFAPLAGMIPAYATAGALIYVAMLMMSGMAHIDWEDHTNTIPAIITVVMMPLTFSVTDGLALGFITFVALKLFTGRHKEITVSLYALAGIAQALQLAQQGESRGRMPVLDQERLGKLGLRVLVAEDNPINQVLLREQLEELGCQVTLAGNGRDAMQSWRPGVFDALITDVNMPLMNGYELAQELRRVDSTIPIIGVTANALKEEGERCIAVGMNAWLVKPINLRTFYDSLLKACAGIVIQPFPLEQMEPHKEEGDVIQVSEKMRDLFVRTMREDIQEVWRALQCNDMATARQQVHRLRGALAVVQAQTLSDACGEVEDALVEQSGSELHAAVGALMNRVESALERLC